MLGDTRWDSVDSRAFGPVSGDDVLGRVVARWWPPSRAGSLAYYPAGDTSEGGGLMLSLLAHGGEVGADELGVFAVAAVVLVLLFVIPALRRRRAAKNDPPP